MYSDTPVKFGSLQLEIITNGSIVSSVGPQKQAGYMSFTISGSCYKCILTYLGISFDVLIKIHRNKILGCTKVNNH